MAAMAVSKKDTNPAYYLLAPLLREEEKGAALARERYPHWMVNGRVPEGLFGISYFLQACKRCEIREAQALLALGANAAAKGTLGGTALMCACSWSLEPSEMVVWLLKHADVRALVNEVNDAGSSALHCASACGHAEVVRVLLCFGADLTTCGKRGGTAASFARLCGQHEVAQLIENWKEPEEWRPWTHASLPRSYRDATSTLAVLARSVCR